MTTVLIVTSAGAGPAAVVPVLAALEVAGVKARAVDIGGRFWEKLPSVSFVEKSTPCPPT
jgi:hypothetical protein